MAVRHGRPNGSIGALNNPVVMPRVEVRCPTCNRLQFVIMDQPDDPDRRLAALVEVKCHKCRETFAVTVPGGILHLQDNLCTIRA